MKMVKSLLLGSAAGLVAVTAGQAADLPVKAKPVEYVKVCSLYGAGFYYMPGTDMCIKIGGWMRTEATWGPNQSASLAWGPYNGDLQQRSTHNLITRDRGYITADAREQSAYGTIRAYIDVGVSTSDVGTAASEGVFSSNRGFLQFAGMTAGVTQSFFDFYSAAAVLYRAGYLPSEDTGDGGWMVWAYTAQFGNGFSATISAEQRRMSQIIDQTAVGAAAAGVAAGMGSVVGTSGSSANGAGYGGEQAPDIVGNIRLDQAWGSAQIMGAGHMVNPLYYSTTNDAALPGNPSTTWGWAVGAGLRLNAPMIAQGDYFQAEVNATRGAVKYANNGEDTNYDDLQSSVQSFGVMSDCVYGGTVAAGNNTNCQLTSVWDVTASYEHYWTPQWHQSLVGAYMRVSYDAAANAMLCAAASGGLGAAQGAGIGSAAVATVGCNNNWSYWGIGSRLQWDLTKSFYLGVEALYTDQQTASTSDGLIHNYAIAGGPAAATTGNQTSWSFTVRAHKDFLP
jgi:hypothetical protein